MQKIATPKTQKSKKTIQIKIQKKTLPKKSDLKSIFEKSNFAKAPGGDRYEWKDAKTIFEIGKGGFYSIKIEASAKNEQQNKSTDDDDLRVALDGFDFGKYEGHDEKVSWKGFGTSASWNGASLKGGTKTIHFFVELEKGKHILQFFADETPTLKSIEVAEVENNTFQLSNFKPDENILSDRDGIPWISFIFFGGPPKNIHLEVKTQSGTAKKTKDGDNLKVVVNGGVLKSPITSNAPKYKNFYFSGDLRERDTLTIPHTQISHPLAFENSIELWYDEEPTIVQLKINFLNEQEILRYLETETNLETLKEQIRDRAFWARVYFWKTKMKYSLQFLKHSLTDNPSPLVFKHNDPLISVIKRDPTYSKIIEKIKEKIATGFPDGEIWPGDFKDDSEMGGKINFNSEDLKTSLHGIRKIEYQANLKENDQYEIKMVLFDVYDFDKTPIPSFISLEEYVKTDIINRLNDGEELGIVRNFEIEIHITQMTNVYF